MRVEEGLHLATIAESVFDGTEQSAETVKHLMQVLVRDPDSFWAELEARTGDVALRQRIEELLRTGQICQHTPLEEAAQLLGYAVTEANPISEAHE